MARKAGSQVSVRPLADASSFQKPLFKERFYQWNKKELLHLLIAVLQCLHKRCPSEISAGAKYGSDEDVLGGLIEHLCSMSCPGSQPASRCNSRCWWVSLKPFVTGDGLLAGLSPQWCLPVLFDQVGPICKRVPSAESWIIISLEIRFAPTLPAFCKSLKTGLAIEPRALMAWAWPCCGLFDSS